MALPLANTFEGGSDETTLTQAVGGNTGGASGDYFDVVSIATNASLVFDNAASAVAHGAMGARFTQSSSSAGNVALRWTTQLGGTPTELWGRCYYRNPVGGTQGPRIVRLYNAGATVLQAAIQLNSTGALQIIGSAANGASTATNSADAWYRAEWHWIAGGAGVGSFQILLYLGDSTTLLTSATNTDIAFGTGTGEVWHGQHNSTALSYVLYMDSFAVNATGYPGPAAADPTFSSYPRRGLAAVS